MPKRESSFEPNIYQSNQSEAIEPEKSEKELRWEKTRREVDEIGDRLGFGIDQGIKETVTAFMVNGFPLSGSCEGHADRALPVPWIEIKAPNEPDERFIGQNEVFIKVAKKYSLTLEQVKTGENDDVYLEARYEFGENGETEEYKRWDKENKKLQTIIQELLEEFYKERKVEPSVKLKIHEMEGRFRIHNGEEDYNDLIKWDEVVSQERKRQRAEKNTRYKKEMDEFAEFLKKKYFTK